MLPINVMILRICLFDILMTLISVKQTVTLSLHFSYNDDLFQLNCLHKGGYLANLEAFNEYMILRSWLAGMNNGRLTCIYIYTYIHIYQRFSFIQMI